MTWKANEGNDREMGWYSCEPSACLFPALRPSGRFLTTRRGAEHFAQFAYDRIDFIDVQRRKRATLTPPSRFSQPSSPREVCTSFLSCAPSPFKFEAMNRCVQGLTHDVLRISALPTAACPSVRRDEVNPCGHGDRASLIGLRHSVYLCRKGTLSFNFLREEGSQIGSSSA